LEAVNQQAVNGVLHATSTTLQKEANDLFDALNKAGAISYPRSVVPSGWRRGSGAVEPRRTLPLRQASRLLRVLSAAVMMAA
jgi:hypothetical protein